MNAGPPKGGSNPGKRRTLTQNIILDKNPDLVLLQELSRHTRLQLANSYLKIGNSRCVIVNQNSCETEDIANAHIETSLNEVRGTIVRRKIDGLSGDDFNPIDRMCHVTIKVDDKRFICVSWHGWNNNIRQRGQMPIKRKRFMFRMFIKFLEALMERCDLPIIVGGDFNIPRKKIRHVLNKPDSKFTLCRYIASERRRNINVIDYVLVSGSLSMENLRYIRNRYEEITALFDHDPLKGSLVLE
jgi:exonuclease III